MLSRLRLFKLCGRQIDFARTVVDVHRLGANSGRYCLRNLEFAALLLGNAELTFTRARKCLVASAPAPSSRSGRPRQPLERRSLGRPHDYEAQNPEYCACLSLSF